jgi:choline dehydrogenase-like flavoprotein
MLEAGNFPAKTGMGDVPSLAALRTQRGFNHHAHLLKPHLAALRDVGYASPKLRTAAEPGFGEDYAASLPLESDGFRVVGALNAGGLTRIWGAAVATFEEEDFGPGIDLHDMTDSYRRVARRIGISGEPNDADLSLPLQPALPLSPLAEGLLAAVQRSAGKPRLKLGRCAVAVTTDPSQSNSCIASRGCMWGCSRGAIYDAASEIPALLATHQMEFRGHCRVVSLQQVGKRWQVRLADGTSVEADCVIAAAGVLATTKLVLQAQRRFHQKLRLLSNPAFSFAAFVPKRLGLPLPETGFGLAQLAFRLRTPDTKDAEIYGLLYDADTMSAVDLIAHMPLTRPGAMALVKALLPGLILGLGYYPGNFSRNRIWLDSKQTLYVQGGVTETLADVKQNIRFLLPKEFRALGAFLLPGSIKDYQQGAEVHYAGTLPVGEETLADGQVRDMPGLYVADASTFLRLPAKSHTFTAMANADRIGRLLAVRMQAEGSASKLTV